MKFCSIWEKLIIHHLRQQPKRTDIGKKKNCEKYRETQV